MLSQQSSEQEIQRARNPIVSQMLPAKNSSYPPEHRVSQLNRHMKLILTDNRLEFHFESRQLSRILFPTLPGENSQKLMQVIEEDSSVSNSSIEGPSSSNDSRSAIDEPEAIGESESDSYVDALSSEH